MDERIRIRDKRREGDESQRNRRRRKKKKIARHFEAVHLKGEYLAMHKDRVEYHRQRVSGEEFIMRKHGINPRLSGSALKFDKLLGKLKG